MSERKWTREENIRFIVQAIEDIEGVKVSQDRFKNYSDEKLEKEADWYDYLYGK